jgi:flavodoxin/NAD-dependent dihydropyrimidine dehydrogenase PreA subunit
MPRSLVIYFSQGGSTTQVAQSIGSGLRAAGHEVTLCNLRDEPPPPLHGYDLLGVGSPVYYYRLPFNVETYIKGLPDMAGFPAFAFVLHATYRGDGGNDLCRGLAQKGARLVGYLHSYGAGTFYGYFKHGYQFSPGHPSTEELARAEAFGQETAERAASQAAAVVLDEPRLAAIYRLERSLIGQWLTRNVYSRLFRVNKAKCTGCGRCVQECPVDNISMNADKHPVWGRECILCLYCEMNCPEEAVSSPVNLPIFLPFLKYNMHAGSHDPKLDHRRATVDHGRLKELP